MKHTSIKNEPKEERCDCEETNFIPFLDISCTIQNGRIETDLYKKETDKYQYLLPSSCHSKQITKSIPFSLGLRIVRACSNTKNSDKRLNELKDLLLARDYNKDMVEGALKRARVFPRDRALRKSNKPKQTQRPVLVTPYDPRLPAITTVQAKHWRTMVNQESYLKKYSRSLP